MYEKSIYNMSPGFEPTPQWIYKFVIVDLLHSFKWPGLTKSI